MVPIPATNLAQLLSAGNGAGVNIQHDLPEGARLVAVYYQPPTDSFLLKFQHETFDAVQPGERIPYRGVKSIHMFDLTDQQLALIKEQGKE